MLYGTYALIRLKLKGFDSKISTWQGSIVMAELTSRGTDVELPKEIRVQHLQFTTDCVE